MEMNASAVLDMKVMDFFTVERLQEYGGASLGTRAHTALTDEVCDFLGRGGNDTVGSFLTQYDTRNQLLRIRNLDGGSAHVIIAALKAVGIEY